MPRLTITLDYIVGILDGEGSFYVVKNKRKKTEYSEVKISLERTVETEHLLNEIQSFFGVGHIYIQPKKYWTKHGLNAKDQVWWKVMAQREVLKVCLEVEPFLQLKREDCRNAIANCRKRL